LENRLLVYLLAVAVVLVAALLAFGIAALLHLQGTAAILFITLILLVGLAAAATILILHFRAKKNQSQEGDPAAGGATGELDMLLNEANRKLRESQQGAKTLDGVPLIYILGETGAAKTTTVIRSGLDPELVAGTAPREGDMVPTPVLNLWFTKLAALLEVGETVRQSNSLLTRLVERTRAKAYRSAFGTGAAARAAVVCVSTEQLLVADAGASLLAAARTTGAQLREISRLLGTPLPVYVIVTKLDRVPHFGEYVRNLSNVEVRQILGSPLPKSGAAAGVYADQAARTLATVLDGLAYKLGEFRVEMLDRETEPANTSGVYEFPREFGKLRKNLNQYLVELCKPSQLSANPYLRGFYFTGIRAQIVERMASAPAAEERAPQDAGATQYLNISLGKSQSSGRAPQPAAMVSARVPQWTFLPRLLPEIILGDKSALSATQQTAPARLFRRILFGTFALLFFVYTILLLISYINNAGIEHRIQTAAKALPVMSASANSLPSMSDLQNLDQLRQTIVQLDGYQQDGAPWSYRFGLYQGDKLAVRARHVYFDRFRPMMLNPTQLNFVGYMRALPETPATNSDFSLYAAAYSPLKAYLITTSNPEKSSSKFLTPVFLQYWTGTRQIDSDQQQLAQKQIDFYANELLRQPPYAITPDTLVVKHARGYLSNFLAETRIYQAMLNDADKTSPNGIDFNKQYPGSALTVVDGHIVRGAFTKSGFTFMQAAIQHPETYANGETWVLGDQAGPSQNTSGTSKDLASQYSTDFIKEWHLFLTDARVVSCGSLREAPAKLNSLAGNASPLLALFYTVSHNTAVADPQIKSTFQPTQVLVDPNTPDHFIGAGNTAYVNALLKLSTSVDQVATAVAQNPATASDPAIFMPINQDASAAKLAANTTAQSFNADPQMHTDATVLALMQEPVSCAAKLPPSPGAATNGAGQKICGATNALLGKFPFAANSTTQASIAEVNTVFAPDTGTIWSIYNASLKPFLVPQGAQYVQAPTAPQAVNPKFAQYFSHAAHISSGLYPAGAKSPTLTFTLRFLPSTGIANATFDVDGQRIPNGSITQQFHWSGDTAQKASVVYDGKEIPPFQGPWALFQLVHQAKITRNAGGYQLDYPINTATTFAGQTISQSTAGQQKVSFELSGPGADALMSDYFSGLGCALPVVK
jgi:type VI secretion system protein ImpL